MDITKNLDKITLELARETLPEIEFIDTIDQERFNAANICFFSDGCEFFGSDLYDQVTGGISSGGTNLIWTQESLDFFGAHTAAIDSILGYMIDQGIELKLEPINPLVGLLWAALEFYWSEWLENIEGRLEQ